MPSTINGIGTAYRGKKNVKTRMGVCDHCHRQVLLQSYETRLCFVVLFLPVVPLEKKQIIDYCPACTWHKSVSLGEWKALGQQAIEQASRQATANPDNPEAAIELHATLSAFHRTEDAERVGKVLAENFAQDVGVQLYLGAWHAEKGRNAEADVHFARALELDPQDPIARRGVGVACIERGDLAKARELLSFMEPRGPQQDAGVLVMLADAFQARGDHAQAMELYQIALGALPRIGQDRRLRKRVARSEAALGRSQSILPSRPFHRRPLFLTAVGAAVAAALVFLFVHFVGRQPVHVVNQLPVPVRVTFDGGDGPHVVPAGQRIAVRLGVGPHHATVARDGVADREVDFDVDAGLWQRVQGKAVFVFNVDGAADLLWEKSIYSKDPPPNDYRLYYGKEFFVFTDIDYTLGQDFPPELKVSEHTKSVAKTRVSVVEAEPMQAMGLFPPGTPRTALLEYAEHHLAVNPADEMLVQFYAGVAAVENQTDRARQFLAKRLDHRPVAVEWHRMYQNACQLLGKDAELVTVYDAMLRESPGDASLLYLRGRAAPTASEAAPLFDRAIAADPNNAYPHMAKAYQLVSVADFAAARKPAAEAFRLKPAARQVEDLFNEVRLALGEFEAMERDLRAKLAANPLDFDAQEELLVVLAASGKLDEAAQAHESYAQTVSARLAQAGMREDPGQCVLRSEMALQYLRGDLAGYRENAAKLQDPYKAAYLFIAQTELGQVKQAEEALGQAADYRGAMNAMLLSLAWKEQNDQAASDRWWLAAVERLAAGSREERGIARLVAKPETVGVKQLNDFFQERVGKAVLLTALAQRSPEHRKELLDQAEKLNLPGLFPHRFLKRQIEALRK